MVVDAVGEPDPLDVDHELGPLGVIAVAFVALDDRVQGLADDQIVLVELGERDVPAGQRGLAQIIDQLLLGRGQGFEARDLVAQDLDVGELVDLPLEFRSRGRGLGRGFRLGFGLFAGGRQGHRSD